MCKSGKMRPRLRNSGMSIGVTSKPCLAHIHERIANLRANFAHQESRKLVDRYQVIVFEDLAPMELGKSHGMRKSILDVAWTQFIQMTVAKVEEAGRRAILVNPRNTTKRCASCGKLVPKKLSKRVHTCPQCGMVLGRDHHAALHMLQRGLQSLRLSQDACGTAHSEAQVPRALGAVHVSSSIDYRAISSLHISGLPVSHPKASAPPPTPQCADAVGYSA